MPKAPERAHKPKPDASPNQGHRERARERFRKIGGGALEDYELLELLRFSNYPRQDTKAIALSFDQTPQNTWEVLQLGARGFLPKTIDPPCLHAALDQLVATGVPVRTPDMPDPGCR